MACVTLGAGAARAPANGVRGRRGSSGSAQRRGEVTGPCVGLCVVANGDAVAVDRVSILLGVMCRRQTCVASVDGARRVSLRKLVEKNLSVRR